MSDFGSGIEQYGPMHELSGRASKADLRRRIAELEAELAVKDMMLRLDIALTCPFGERSPDGIETCPSCSERLADLRRQARDGCEAV